MDESSELFEQFQYAHLPPHLQEISKKFYELALWMMETLPAGLQRTQGLWELLRAKDCAVRAIARKKI